MVKGRPEGQAKLPMQQKRPGASQNSVNIKIDTGTMQHCDK